MIDWMLDTAISYAVAGLVVRPRARARPRSSALHRQTRALAVAYVEASALPLLSRVLPAFDTNAPRVRALPARIRAGLVSQRGTTVLRLLSPSAGPGLEGRGLHAFVRWVTIAAASKDADRRLRDDVETVLWSFILTRVTAGASKIPPRTAIPRG